MILKNEEPNVHRLLGKLGHLFDEIAVCDTGSTDGTIAACLRYGAKVIERPWNGFGDARNHALRLTRSRFCLWLDGDDDMSPESVWKVRSALEAAGDNMAFFLNLYCHSPYPERRMTCQQLRIHPNLPGIRWERRVHEQVVGSCSAIGCHFAYLPMVVEHLGYDIDGDMNTGKYERNLSLLQMELQDRPGELITLFHIAQTLIGLGREREAVIVLEEIAKTRSKQQFVNSLATRAAMILANIITQTADKTALNMLEEAINLTPEEDMIRVSLAERYNRMGQKEKVRPTLMPIYNRGGLNYSLLPYPMEIAGYVAVRLWHENS